MFFTYLLKSAKDNKLYIGSTNNLTRRIKEHNSGLVESTKHRTPFSLAYYEAYTVEEEARHREHNLKLRAKAFQQLRNRVKKSIAAA